MRCSCSTTIIIFCPYSSFLLTYKSDRVMVKAQKIRNCLVCNTSIAHTHMGVDSCRACGVFYRRNVKQESRLQCNCGGKDISRKGLFLSRTIAIIVCTNPFVTNLFIFFISVYTILSWPKWPHKIISCRKCRFDKMKQLVITATAGQINCVNDRELPNENDVEIAEEVPDLPLIAATQNDAELANEMETDEVIDDPSPPFIDHTRYFACEPSCSDTPLLDKMKDAYSTLCLVRKSCEMNCLHHLEMHSQLKKETMTLRPAQYSNMVQFSQIFFVGLMDFAVSSFPEFSELSPEIRHNLVHTNFTLISSLDGSYRSNHHFSNDSTVMLSYTCYVNEDTIDDFFKDSPQEKNREEAADQLRKNMELTNKTTKARFGNLKPSIEEFIALFGMALWNDCKGLLSTEGADLVRIIRKKILKELQFVYSKRGLKECAPRLGELFCLLVNEEACV